MLYHSVKGYTKLPIKSRTNSNKGPKIIFSWDELNKSVIFLKSNTLKTPMQINTLLLYIYCANKKLVNISLKMLK